MVARLPQLRSFEPQNALLGFRQGRDDAQQQQSRNALLRAGQAASEGDFDAASSAAFEGGQLQAGTALRGIGIEDQKREVDQLARLAFAADTPEKMQQAAQAVAQKFGPERAQQFLSTPRDQLIAEAQSVSQQLDRQFREQQAGRSQANADRTFGLQEQRLDIARQAATTRGTGKTTDIKNFELAKSQGFEGTFFDFKKQLAEAKAGTKPITDAQAKAAGFADRMIASNKIFATPAITEASVDRSDRAVGNVPFVGSALQSEAGQQAAQAKIDFITSILRRESGAVISDSEFVTEDKKFFPQPGDTSATIKQKAAARERAIRGVIRAAGPAAEGLTVEAEGDVIDAADFFK